MVCVLQYKLFYANEPVDKLHKIIASWKPGLFPRRFLDDVLEVAETQLKLLEANRKEVEDADNQKKSEAGKKVRRRQTAHQRDGGFGSIVAWVPSRSSTDDGVLVSRLCWEQETKSAKEFASYIAGFELDRYFANLCTNQVPHQGHRLTMPSAGPL